MTISALEIELAHLLDEELELASKWRNWQNAHPVGPKWAMELDRLERDLADVQRRRSECEARLIACEMEEAA